MATAPKKAAASKKDVPSLSDLVGKDKDTSETTEPTNEPTSKPTDPIFKEPTSPEHTHENDDDDADHEHEPAKTDGLTKENEKDDVPVEKQSAVDKEHSYKNLGENKGTFNDQIDSKTGVNVDHVVPLDESNAVHTGITDNYPNDFTVPRDYPPNESGTVTRRVTERYYATPAENDDKFDPTAQRVIQDLNEAPAEDLSRSADDRLENEQADKEAKLEDESASNFGKEDINEKNDQRVESDR